MSIHDNTRQYTTITTMTMHWSVTSQTMAGHRCAVQAVSNSSGAPPLRLLRTLRIPPLLRHLLVARPRVRILLGILYSIAKY